MITCRNGGVAHQHSTVIESKACYGLIPMPRQVQPQPTRPYLPPVDHCTPRQLSYIKDLGGDADRARGLTKEQASLYIDQLKNRTKNVTSQPAAATRTEDPRLSLIKGMIDMIPDGYFAVQEYEGGHVTFMRVSTPKTGKWRTSRKFQTQHGPALEVEGVLWLDSGRWSIYRGSLIDSLMLLVPDYKGAALRYAKKIGKCCRCNSPLTDERSRHYGIGPECEEHWPWVIDEVDALDHA